MKVAIVILNWNGRQMMEQYLPSVVRYSADAAIIVADNSSTDDSIAWLASNYPQISVIRLEDNYGFAGGYNRALAQVDSEYYLLLNSDVEVTEGWLSPLMAAMEQYKEVVACQPKLLSYVEKDKFEYAGGAGGHLDRYGYPFCRGRIFDSMEQDKGQYDEPEEIFWATGACLLIRSAAFWKVGGFDERFFAHNEEIDLCWRLQQAGGRIFCFPESHVYHLGGGTLSASNPRKTFLNFRNNLTMLWKNLPQRELRKVMRIRFFLDHIAILKTLLLDGNLKEAQAILAGRRAFKEWRNDFIIERRHIESKENQGVRDMRKSYSVLWKYYVEKRHTYKEL
ncbi:MAG: glycosyltransferase family 2 protein [Prevotella sp.]|nr:glycosyltransferase family 2 protein [Prevotellaceae bacterium]MDY3936615.1 glycosyltransferase family 2 protein [Prevotella sp.]